MARPRDKPLSLTDPRALRAYAHPTRMQLVSLLRAKGPLTATETAELLGQSSGSTSFHLRQLAKYGLVEETGEGRGRQKPWRVVAESTVFPDEGGRPDNAAAAESVRIAQAQRYFNQVLRAIGRSHREPRTWQRASRFGDARIFVTAAELTAITRAIDEAVAPYLARADDPANRPRNARQVTLLNVAFPIDGPSGRGQVDD